MIYRLIPLAALVALSNSALAHGPDGEGHAPPKFMPAASAPVAQTPPPPEVKPAKKGDGKEEGGKQEPKDPKAEPKAVPKPKP